MNSSGSITSNPADDICVKLSPIPQLQKQQISAYFAQGYEAAVALIWALFVLEYHAFFGMQRMCNVYAGSEGSH